MEKLKDFDVDLDLKKEIAERNYKYQKNLTDKLDKHIGDFSETTLLEIALWKTNRYPEISKELIESINDLRRNYTESKAKEVLRQLLSKKGFDLPMASTVLRFALPEKFQIIDQRVYRFITSDKECLKIPYNVEQKISFYFNYINDLKTICKEKGIAFSKADRILYQMDKDENKKFPLKKY